MTESQSRPVTSLSFRWTLIGICLVVLIAALVLVLGTKTVPYSVQVPFEANVEEALRYRVVRAHAEGGLGAGLGIVANAYVKIENTDTEPGTFLVNFTFKTLNRTLTDSKTVYIVPGESRTAHGQGDTKLGEDWNWHYTVTPGVKKVVRTQFRTETRYREVPLYKWLTGLVDSLTSAE